MSRLDLGGALCSSGCVVSTRIAKSCGALAIVAMMYVLSVGPVFWWVRGIDPQEPIYAASETFYLPLAWVSTHCHAAERVLDWYISRCAPRRNLD